MGSRYDLAIVTGGSSGIGKSIIELFVKLEPEASVFNLSRKLPALFSNGSRFHHLKCDLASREDRAATLDTLQRSLRQSASNGPILLVNNAGFGAYGPTADRSPREHLDLLEVNVNALVETTATLLPFILQRGGSIMNIASTAAFQPTPNFATYGASKAFVLNWTLALNEELRGSKAQAIAICPGPTDTEFFSRAGAKPQSSKKRFTQSPDQVAKLAFDALERNKSFTVTGRLNRLIASGARLFPLSLSAKIAGKTIARLRKSK